MKKVLIIGASGSLASYVIDALQEKNNIELTLFARNKNRIDNMGNAHVIEGDAMNYGDVQSAVAGQDIVYVNLAGNLEVMTNNIVKAMKEKAVKRIIAISSIGIYDIPGRPVLQPYRKLADIIENSGLDYTILRPDWFTNANEIDYHITRKSEPEVGGALSRKSIAAFVAKLIDNSNEYIHENLGISKL
ncbi:NAD(P)H-binding protein [Chryseobacterium culicis]|uniref:NAD(P)H-binding n=1 Tax=Chryseobacterium culicis TaxID=680127 RepID=A0A1H6IMY2_CHRCI|nr:NAD(P)H-binding protein [Chryseobacterium culicis]SEH47894.1 NAD(P)H-binding [Chryseobacterium culicis]